MSRTDRRFLIREISRKMAAAMAAGDFRDWFVLRAQRDGWEWLFDAWRQEQRDQRQMAAGA
jgi:hypothetical protein